LGRRIWDALIVIVSSVFMGACLIRFPVLPDFITSSLQFQNLSYKSHRYPLSYRVPLLTILMDDNAPRGFQIDKPQSCDFLFDFKW
jgi:hypothetical protein